MRAPKKRRLYLLLACGVCLSAATGLSLAAFSSTLTYFLSPASVIAKNPAPGMSFRLGGIVQVGTVATTIDAGTPTTSFRVTDGQASIPVTFTGVLPDLFREGQGGGHRLDDDRWQFLGRRSPGQARRLLYAEGRRTGP